MKRRQFILGLSTLVTLPALAGAQQRKGMPRLGVLMTIGAEAKDRIAALNRGLRTRGWIDGENLEIDYHWADGNKQRIADIANVLVNSRPDLILAHSSPAVPPFLRLTQDIPIVFVQVSDPVGQGFVKNLTRPGGNVTGFAAFEFSVGGKWVELLKELSPNVDRVGILYNPSTTPYEQYVVHGRAAADALGIALTQVEVRESEEIKPVLGKFGERPGGGLALLPDPFTSIHRDEIVGTAARLGVPAIYPYRAYVDSGGLCSYSYDVSDLFFRSATYVDRILRGEKPGDLPVQLVTRYQLVFNLKTAKTMGLALPPTLLARADEVIE
ncbi:ABC transporter substrate-binding protein [Bradyrhizobium sp. BR13661]|jgi:putative ABC transport system substrate-binding protein|uniref:ABC transporter substrate-binding protein n=1 Tax=Bradyrhizobium sp. BR13661 TaxID=2940622 RepID=UPI00247614CD|nr:ABC transporter substrate-binding protein [Bradyrhizobium sp. BR13661]MDH6256579.1 putative ABC transport system substrate-binding protein [Bradyrhizobium sp. BR13661]